MKNSKQYLIIGVMTIAIVALSVWIFISSSKVKEKEAEIAEVVEILDSQKVQLEEEYQEFANELDGYTVTIHNDSLIAQLANEKQKVTDLMQELKKTKSIHARKIRDLKKELVSLRKVISHLVMQIDSLNAQNKALVAENVAVKKRYENATEEAEQLAEEKENLSQVVTRAAIMETYNFQFTPLNKRDRPTKKARKMRTLQFSFTIGKNITTASGMKTVYLRLIRPDGELMTKSADQLMKYEDKMIGYSIEKTFEYGGDALNQILYWKVGEMLPLGTYQADIFIDGNRVGNYTFRIEKK